MNLAYFRKSSRSHTDTIEALKKALAESKLNVNGESALPFNQGVVFNVCNTEWLHGVMKKDRQLLGLMPCSVVVVRNGNDVYVGSGNPSILSTALPDLEVKRIAVEAEKTLRKVIHEAAGVGELEVKSVTLYSTTTCPYCKMEEDWLKHKGVEYDLKLVDLNREEAEKMVQKTGQMGVPVTGITFDDGSEEFVVGFDKEKLAQYIGR